MLVLPNHKPSMNCKHLVCRGRRHGLAHLTPLPVPASITLLLLPLPRYGPELNPVDTLWEFLRANFLSHRVWDGCAAVSSGAAR
jgi:transposase